MGYIWLYMAIYIYGYIPHNSLVQHCFVKIEIAISGWSCHRQDDGISMELESQSILWYSSDFRGAKRLTQKRSLFILPQFTACNLGISKRGLLNFEPKARALVETMMVQDGAGFKNCHQVRVYQESVGNYLRLPSLPGRALGSFNLCPQWHVVTWLILDV